MDKHVFRRKLTLLVAAVLCLIAARATSSAADTTPESSSASPVIGKGSAASVTVFDDKVGRVRQVSAAEAAKIIRQYWTPERRAAATPDFAIGNPEVALKKSRPEGAGVARRVAMPKLPTLGRTTLGKTPSDAISNVEGKVYYLKPDRSSWQCSGSAVNSGKRRLVWTAGHCVHTGPGDTHGRGWMLNWEFVPAYDHGTRPAGTFPVYQLWGKNAWINNGDFNYDYGVAITQTNETGWRVVDKVGGNGLIINPGEPFVTAIGYPSNIYGGEAQSSCQGWLSRSNSKQKLNCSRCPGGSGEPWLQNYSGGLGSIVSNYSLYTTVPNCIPLYGPYYDEATVSLYREAENASP